MIKCYIVIYILYIYRGWCIGCLYYKYIILSLGRDLGIPTLAPETVQRMRRRQRDDTAYYTIYTIIMTLYLK